MTPRVAILGTGMGALGADDRLRRDGLEPVLFDKEPTPGGHTRTHVYDGGWFFDEGPHVSFTSDERIRGLLADAIRDDFLELKASIDNYWKGYWIKHPAQTNLFGLPVELVVSCLSELVGVANSEPGEIGNYEQWLHASFGPTFASTFPMTYARKVHTTEAANLTTDWLGPRLYRPSLEEVIRGALTDRTSDHHYVTTYRYPKKGGFHAYIAPFLRRANLRLGHDLSRLDPRERILSFTDRTNYEYDAVISSLPLTVLIPRIAGVPSEVTDAARRLAVTSVTLVNVGIDRDDFGGSWSYFYDEDIVFARVSYPHRLSPAMTPTGTGSFQCEIYRSEKYLPLIETDEALVERAIADLRKTGLIRDSDKILHTSLIHVPFANIIHDFDKVPSLNVILPYLEEIGVQTCGRYGLWGYQWTDEAFKTGEAAAEAVLTTTGAGAARAIG